jgi:hypothetical protein
VRRAAGAGKRPVAFTSPSLPCQKRAEPANRRDALKPDEILKLDRYFKRVFQNPNLEIKARPRKEDSCEVYIGDEFLGLVYKDEEEGDYNFSMAILDIDLD